MTFGKEKKRKYQDFSAITLPFVSCRRSAITRRNPVNAARHIIKMGVTRARSSPIITADTVKCRQTVCTATVAIT